MTRILPPRRAAWYGAWSDLPGGRDEWERALAAAGTDSPFLSWEWQSAWWDAYRDRHDLWLLAGESATAALVRTRWRPAPFASLRVLRLCGGGTGDSHDLDVLSAGDPGAAAGELVAALEARGGWDLLELAPVCAESTNLAAVRAVLETRGWRTHAHRWPHRVLELPSDWDDYPERLSPKTARMVDYAVRRLEREGALTLRRADDAAAVERFMSRLFELEGRRAAEQGREAFFAARVTRDLFTRAALDFLGRGRLDLWSLESGGRAIGVHLGFRSSATHTYLVSAFQAEMERFSPGTVMLYLLMRELHGQGVRTIDFLGGDEPYKARLRAQRREYVRLRGAPPGSRGAFWLAASGGLAKARAGVRQALPGPALRLLRTLRGRMAPARPVPLENE